jgi:DNA-binding NtrC family response regulator
VRTSRRAGKPFVRFNCASLTAELAEAELFGHVRGAFTGAVRSRAGLFGEADGGTVLLDEVSELALPLQGMLLRVLQEGEIRAVGEDRPRHIDVRVLAASNRDLKAEVARGAFREDLYWRLAVVELHIPPLRERPDDIPVLARHFLDRAAERLGGAPFNLPDALFARLVAHSWPGNVRELQNAIERLVALSPEGEIDLSLFSPGGPSPPPDDQSRLRDKLDAYERGLIVDALRGCAGNRSEAARQLGISRVTLHDKLRKHGITGNDGTS